MSAIFRLECTKCKQFMRYDRDYFIEWDIMVWCCWECETELTTSNLYDTVIRIGGEEE